MPFAESKIVDVAVMGGGIAGAAIAREASLRGFSVVLFEKNSFGSATSSKSSKLIHGGIRYLDMAWEALLKGQIQEALKNFRFVFHSLGECQILEKELPELVKPLPLVIPIYKEDRRHRFMVFLGTFLYFLLALLSGGGRKPQFFWTKFSLLKILPQLNPINLLGGVLIWDHQTDDKALVQKTIELARKHGALCFENAKVLHYRFLPKDKLYELDVQENGNLKKVHVKKIFNASGPWVDQIRRNNDSNFLENFILPIAGSHIEFKTFLPYSVILQAQDHRIFFAIHLGNKTRVGTTEWHCPDPEKASVSEKDIDYLLSSLKRYFPSILFNRSDIVAMDVGVRPLAFTGSSQNPTTVSREHQIRTSSDGVIHVLGVKLTDHRRAAKEAVNLIV